MGTALRFFRTIDSRRNVAIGCVERRFGLRIAQATVLAFAPFVLLPTTWAADLPPVPLNNSQLSSPGVVQNQPASPAVPTPVAGDEVIDALAPGRLTPIGGAEWGQDPVAMRPAVALSNGSPSASTPPVAVAATRRPAASPTPTDLAVATAQPAAFDPLSPLGLAVFATVMLGLFGAGWYVVRRR